MTFASGIDGQATGTDTPASKRRRKWVSTPKIRLVIAGAVVVCGLIAVAVWQASSTTSNSSALEGPKGRPAPAFVLPSLAQPNRHLSLASFRGKPLVVNFWASWCVPCRAEMPRLEQAYRAERGKVQFLGIDTNDSVGAARTFLERVGVTYPTVTDNGGSVETRYLLYGLPTTVFISSTGKIVGRHVGELHSDTLRVALREAFGV